MPSRPDDWNRLNAATTWLSHAAILDPPEGDAASRPVWRAIAEARFDAAMALAEDAFAAGGGGDVCEAMGLLCRISRREDLAEEFFALAPPPDARVWRNRGVAALWARRWSDAAAAFARGAGNGANGRWCDVAHGLMATVARRWSLAAAILGEPTRPAGEDGLEPLAHLCRMAAAFGLSGLAAEMGPDLRPALLTAPETAAPPPNPGSGRPERGLAADLILFLACDPAYLDRHGLAALASFALSHPGRRLGAHLHLYDPTPPSAALARRAAETLGLDLVLTAETTPAEAGRFLADAALLIGDSLGRGRRLWFLDQWALLLAAARHPRALRRLPWRCVYDTDFRETSWVWQANDDRKSRSPAYLEEVARLRRAALTGGA